MEVTKRIIYVSSEDSKIFFPTNNQQRFTYVLSAPFILEGKWEVGLRDITVTLSTAVQSMDPIILDISLEQASGNIRQGIEMVIKRAICNPRKDCTSIYSLSGYLDTVKLRSPYLDRLDFVITPVQPNNLSFDNQASAHLTLILQKVREN